MKLVLGRMAHAELAMALQRAPTLVTPAFDTEAGLTKFKENES